MRILFTRNLMDLDFYSIPISLLRQQCFCPRIPYFYLLRELQPQVGFWVNQGKDYHERMQDLMKRRVLTHYGITETVSIKFNVALKSERLGLHGICDCVLFGEAQCYPIEFKLGKYNLRQRGTQVQLAAYALLCEEQFGLAVKQGFVINPRELKPHRIFIDIEQREYVKQIVSEIQNNCQKAIMPDSSASEAQCSQCEFLNFCGDRL